MGVVESSSPEPRCGSRVNPSVSQAPAVPSNASTRRAAGTRETVRSVSSSAAAASAAASHGVKGGVRRVLTLPGTGSLAITTIWASDGPIRPGPSGPAPYRAALARLTPRPLGR